MNTDKVGQTIAYLRKRAGYTQKDLADRIGISDKAISKWERGINLPDIVYLRKLSILLDTDSDSLLSGDIFQHSSNWSGVIILDDEQNGVGADTIIFDKPLVYYLLSYFMLVGIRKILIICSNREKEFIDRNLSGGKDFGIDLQTRVGEKRDILRNQPQDHENIMLVYGRCFLYGVDQTRFFQKAMTDKAHFTMLAMPGETDRGERNITIDIDKRIINTDTAEPIRTQYDYREVPIAFFPAKHLRYLSEADSYHDFIDRYAKENEVYVEMLDRGFVEMEINDCYDVQDAATFMRIVQDKCGMNVYCLEEVAWRRGMISLEKMEQNSRKYEGTEYGEYIKNLAASKRQVGC